MLLLLLFVVVAVGVVVVVVVVGLLLVVVAGSYNCGWPHSNKKGIPTPSELAEAGFFFVGPGDFCKCFQV